MTPKGGCSWPLMLTALRSQPFSRILPFLGVNIFLAFHPKTKQKNIKKSSKINKKSSKIDVLSVLGPSWHHLGAKLGPMIDFLSIFFEKGSPLGFLQGSILAQVSCFFASFFVLFFHYPSGPHFSWIFIDFSSHFGVLFVTFPSILEMCWKRLFLESQPLPALSGGIRFHTFSHLFSHSRPEPCFSHFFLDFGLHFGVHFGTFSFQKEFRKPC